MECASPGDETGDGTLSILRKRYNHDIIYETVIPDAGRDKDFALGVVDLLNSQGSETGQTRASS